MSDIERDVMEYDAVIVGGGPAGLVLRDPAETAATRTQRLPAREGRDGRCARFVGCVLEPGPLDALRAGLARRVPGHLRACRPRRVRLPDQEQALQAADAAADEQSRQLHHVARQPVTAMLATKAEAARLSMSSPGSPRRSRCSATDGAVAGVQIGDMGLDKDGEPGENFAPGPEIRAKTTILAEGCRGSISKLLISRFRLDAGKSPQTYGLGIKELWQLPDGRVEPGLIQHTVGFPDGHARPTAAAFCTTSTRIVFTSASSSASTMRIRASSRSRRSSSSRIIRA